jgi:methionine biosynthesis protein MetW
MLQKAVFSKNFRILVEQLRTAPEEFNDPVPLVLQETNVPQFTPRIQFLLDRVPEGARVLDLGSGKGEVAFFLKSKKRASVVCIEREPEYVTLCREKGLKVIDADLNHLDGPALRWALSQRWDVAIIIDSLNYWSYPALILSALSDRVGKVLVTIANGGHIRKRLEILAGKMPLWPNTRPRSQKDNVLEFDLSWSNQIWTLQGFGRWAEALGYHAELLGRRTSGAVYKKPGLFPSLLARGFVLELTPKEVLPI